MKTRINKKNESISISLNHDELTDLWLALNNYKDVLKNEGLVYSSVEVDKMYRKLLKECVKLGKIEEQNRL